MFLLVIDCEMGLTIHEKFWTQSILSTFDHIQVKTVYKHALRLKLKLTVSKLKLLRKNSNRQEHLKIRRETGGSGIIYFIGAKVAKDRGSSEDINN